jgi:Tfp pilus assembly protein PilO
MHNDDQLGFSSGDGPVSRHWHLDKRVPIALILTLLVQTGGVAWWMATTSERISVLKERLDAISPQADRLTRVEVNIEDIKMSLTEIKQALKTSPLREH